MARYITTAAVQGRRAGEVLDSAQDPAALIASLQAAGVLVALPNAPVEAASANAAAAYAAGAGDETANALMTAGLVRGVGGLAAKGRDVLWSNGDGDAKTWAEVMSIVALSPLGPIVTPWFLPESSGQAFIEPPGVYDFRHGKFAAAYTGAGGNTVNVIGSELRDVSGILGATLHFQTGSSLTWSPRAPGDVNVLILQFGGGLQNDGAGPVPVRIPNGDNPLIVGAILGGGIVANSGPVVSLGPGAILYSITLNSTTGLAIGDNTIVSDDGTSIVIVAHDGIFTGFPNNPGFLGTMLNVPLTNDGGSGPTAARPSAILIGGTLPPGWKYYDTTINKPIVVNAANAWVDYAGNPV